MTERQEKQIEDVERENEELRHSLEALKKTRQHLASLSEKLTRLYGIIQELNSLDIDKIAQAAVTKVPRVIRAGRASLYLYEYESNELVLKTQSAGEPLTERFSLDHHRNSIMRHAFEKKEIVLIHDIAEYESDNGLLFERPFADQYKTRSCISAPLLTGEFVVGMMNFADKTDGGPFDELSDLPIVEQLAQVVAMALRNCKLFSEVQRQARTDGLTRLSNYRAFHDMLQAEIHRSERYTRSLSLLMLDVDSFKQVNDRFGHLAGDYVLAQLGAMLTETLRREDSAARYGGDEFALILPETDLASAKIVAERILDIVRAHRFEFEGRSIPVAISLGVAQWKEGMTIERLIESADKAMYSAKSKGKDRMEIA